LQVIGDITGFDLWCCFDLCY